MGLTVYHSRAFGDVCRDVGHAMNWPVWPDETWFRAPVAPLVQRFGFGAWYFLDLIGA